MDLLKSFITPQKIGSFLLKRMIIPNVGHRYIYTTNHRYIRPFSVNKDKISQDEFNDLIELYNQEVLYEIEGDSTYADGKIAEFAFLYEQLSAAFGMHIECNTLQLYNGESQAIVYFRKSTFIATVYNENSDKIQLVCIAPEFDFQIDYILSYINQLDLREVSKDYVEKLKLTVQKDCSKTVTLYCLNPFISNDIIQEKFNAHGWEIDLRN